MCVSLFRGKTVDKGLWVEGWYGEKSFGAWPLRPAITPCEDAQRGHLYYEEVIPNTVSQYTGLTDKSGKKAFEGDCINHHFGPEIGIIRYGQYRNTFNDDQFAAHVGFYVEWKGPQANSLRKDLGFWLSLNGVSVIGNIHDNPELLKGGVSDGL